MRWGLRLLLLPAQMYTLHSILKYHSKCYTRYYTRYYSPSMAIYCGDMWGKVVTWDVATFFSLRFLSSFRFACFFMHVDVDVGAWYVPMRMTWDASCAGSLHPLARRHSTLVEYLGHVAVQAGALKPPLILALQVAVLQSFIWSYIGRIIVPARPFIIYTLPQHVPWLVHYRLFIRTARDIGIRSADI